MVKQQKKVKSTEKILFRRKRGKGQEGFFTDDFYQDKGCEVSDQCLTCELSQCKHDDPIWYQTSRRLVRDINFILTMQNENLNVDEASEKFKMSTRQIYRIKRRALTSTLDPESTEFKIFTRLNEKLENAKI